VEHQFPSTGAGISSLSAYSYNCPLNPVTLFQSEDEISQNKLQN